MRKLIALTLAILVGGCATAIAQPKKAPFGTRPAATVPLPAAKPATTTAPAAKLTVTQIQQNPFVLLENIATADLQAALADANAQTCPATSPSGTATPCPDTVGVNCYTALLALKSNPAFALPSGSIPGVFTAIQKGRDLKTQLANLVSPQGPLANLNAQCAAWTQDNIATLIAIGGAVGLVANPVGLTATVGGAAAGLPAAMAAFLAAIPK